MGNQMGVRAVISSLFLKEPVTIQYRGNRKKITMTTRMATEKTLYPLEVPLRSVFATLNWMAEKMAMMRARTTPMAQA